MNFYYFHKDYSGGKNGIDQKVQYQVDALKKLGLNVYLITPNRIEMGKIQLPYPLNIFIREFRYNRVFLKTILKLKKGDILYSRIHYPFIDYLYALIKKRDCKIVIEFQTKERDEYRLQKKYEYLLLDFLFGRLIRQNIDGFIAVTDEIRQFQIQKYNLTNKSNVVIGNGFSVESVVLRNPPRISQTDDLHLLCVANVCRWHGIDRLIRGMAQYKHRQKIHLHIAGEGEETPLLKKICKEFHLENSIHFYGFQSGKTLDDLFNRSHIAVGSLGIHRKGLTSTSELKAREYCARGIPFIIGCGDPDFPEDFPYILRLPADETPIDINQVISFAYEVYLDDHSQKMHEYAKENLDWSIKMQKLKVYLEDLENSVNAE